MNRLSGMKYSALLLSALALAGCRSGLESMANKGDINSQNELAFMRFYGSDSGVDYQNAYELFGASGAQGSSLGNFYTGYILQNGLGGLEPNLAAAQELYRAAYPGLVAAAQESHDVPSLFALALMLGNGWGVDADPEAAQTLLEFCARQNYAPAQGLIGAGALASNPEIAERALLAAGDARIAAADFYLYNLYHNSDREQEAVEALNRAVKKAYPPALYTQSLIYLAAEQPRKAEPLMKQAAQLGFAPGAYEYALRFAANDKERYDYLHMAAVRDYEPALMELALLYTTSPLPNYVEAMAIYKIVLAMNPENQEAKAALASLDRDTGMLLVLEQTWTKLYHGEDLTEGEIDLIPVILAHKAGIIKGSNDEFAKLAQEDSDALYLGNAWYRLWDLRMPMAWIKNVFVEQSHDEEFSERIAGLALQYAIIAGLSGNGDIQVSAAQALRKTAESLKQAPAAEAAAVLPGNIRTDLSGVLQELNPTLPPSNSATKIEPQSGSCHAMLTVLADLLEANGYLLQGDEEKAYALLETRGAIPEALLADGKLVNFMNYFCRPLLLRKEQVATATGIPETELGSYARPAQQEFFLLK